jgi:hypothetical protein
MPGNNRCSRSLSPIVPVSWKRIAKKNRCLVGYFAPGTSGQGQPRKKKPAVNGVKLPRGRKRLLAWCRRFPCPSSAPCPLFELLGTTTARFGGEKTLLVARKRRIPPLRRGNYNQGEGPIVIHVGHFCTVSGATGGSPELRKSRLRIGLCLFLGGSAASGTRFAYCFVRLFGLTPVSLSEG